MKKFYRNTKEGIELKDNKIYEAVDEAKRLFEAGAIIEASYILEEVANAIKLFVMMKNKKAIFCDPGMCEECRYIGDGDFFCDKLQEIVISDWQPTDDYLGCRAG